jgi:O-antigen/teichoic acid export membrane protein
MKNRFLRNSTFGSIAGLSATLGSFLSGLVVARTLGVEKTGLVAFLVWGGNMAVGVASAGIPFTISRFIPDLTARNELKQANQLAANLFWPYLALSQIPALCILGYAIWQLAYPDHSASLGAQPTNDPFVWLIIAGLCATQALADYFRGYLKGLQDFSTFALITCLSMVAQLIAIGMGALFFDYPGAIAGYLMGNLPFAALVTRIFRRQRRSKLDPELKKRLIRYAGYRWASEITSIFLWSRIEFFFLQAWWGSESVGLYTVGLTLSNLAVQGPLMLTWGLLPRFSEQFGRRDLDGIRRSYATATRLLAFLVFPACFGLAAIMPEILPLLFSKAFADAVPIAIILVCSAAFTSTTAVAGNILLAMERSDVDFYAGLLGAILSAVSGFLIISTYGAIGAAWSRAIIQIIVVSVGCSVLVFQMGFSIPIRELLKIIVAATLCAVVARAVLFIVPGTIGLPFGIVAGGLIYFSTVRFSNALTDEDILSLRTLARSLPSLTGRFAEMVLRLISKQSR